MTVCKEQYPKQYMFRQIVKAKLFIDQNYFENIGLDDMADQAHFSKYHFIRLFKNIYDLTPNQYLTQVRIEQAKRLIENGIAAKEVGMAVGFNSISTFKGLYKTYTGKTLSAYQKEQKSLQVSMRDKPLTQIPHCLTKIPDIRKKQFSRPLVPKKS
jgi:AraC-like DNA-binding protein